MCACGSASVSAAAGACAAEQCTSAHGGLHVARHGTYATGCCYGPAIPRRRLGEVDEDVRQRVRTHMLHSHTHVHAHTLTQAHTRTRTHAFLPVARTHAHANSHARTHACMHISHAQAHGPYAQTNARTHGHRSSRCESTHTLWDRLPRCTAALAALSTVAALCALCAAAPVAAAVRKSAVVSYVLWVHLRSRVCQPALQRGRASAPTALRVLRVPKGKQRGVRA